MNFRMVPPKNVEKEADRLFRIWSALPDDKCGEWFDYLEKHGSEAVHEYLRECDYIRASLQPGEYV